VNVKCTQADLRLLAQWLTEGLTVHVDRVVDVRNVADGLLQLHRGGVVGRIVVDVPDTFRSSATA
jgi:hypothetical protein